MSATESATAAPDGPGRFVQWVTGDPVRAAASAIVVIAVLIRVQIASRGYLTEDDFVFVNRAVGSNLTVDYLFGIFSNHLMPGGMFALWAVAKLTGLAYWPYVLVFALGQAALGVSFFRLLRLLVRPGWGQLVPLGVLMFSPLTLDNTSMLTVGMFLLPMELAMVWAIGAQVKYVRTRRPRHLVSLGGAVVFGLAFYEKALLVVPLVVLATVLLLDTGSPLRGFVRVVRRDWPAMLVLAGVSAGYLWLYLAGAPCDPTACAPALGFPSASVGDVLTFVGELVGTTLIPGLMGGPWQWLYTGDGPPLAGTPEELRWLAWTVFLTLVVGTILMRRVAARAWGLFASYVLLVAGVFVVSRLGSVYGDLAGLLPRYIADAVVVGALCIGVALLGLRDDPVPAHSRSRIAREPAFVAASVVVGIIAVIAFGVGTASSSARFSDDWADKRGRDYLNAARADIAAAPPGTVFFDQTVPTDVLAGYFWPDNLQSQFFRTLEPRPVFVTEAAQLSVFDSSGHVRPASIQGRANVPGPVRELDCGYRVHQGQPTLIPLVGDDALYEWDWVIRIGYLSSGDSRATARFGTAVHEFDVHNGLNSIFFLAKKSSGKAVELTVHESTVTLCTNDVIVGLPVPLP